MNQYKPQRAIKCVNERKTNVKVKRSLPATICIDGAENRFSKFSVNSAFGHRVKERGPGYGVAFSAVSLEQLYALIDLSL